MKNKILPIILALVAVAAIIVCVVFNGQKSDLQKELNNATTQVEQLKADAAKAARRLSAPGGRHPVPGGGQAAHFQAGVR